MGAKRNIINRYINQDSDFMDRGNNVAVLMAQYLDSVGVSPAVIYDATLYALKTERAEYQERFGSRISMDI